LSDSQVPGAVAQDNNNTAAQDDIAAIARGGRTNFIGFFLRLAARIPFLFIAGRMPQYGPEALGRFASALVVIELVAMICSLGEKRGLAQRLSETDRRPANVVADGVLLSLTLSCTAAGLLWLFPAPLFPSGHYSPIDRLIVLAIPPLALTEIWLAGLAYRFNVGATVRARAIVEPWTLSLMAGAMAFVAPEGGLSLAYMISIFAAGLAAAWPFYKTYGMPQGWHPRPREMVRLMMRTLPLATADTIEWGTRRLDIFILGLFASPAVVGIYYVAQQVASLPQKLKTSFEPILGPVITRSLKEKDYAAIARQVCQVGFWITAAQAGIALALGIPAEGVMGLIGPQFVGGTGALAFLLAAEVVAATAVVSEAALIYMAKLRNLWISIATIALQGVLTLAGIWLVDHLGFGHLHRGAAAAAALMLALAAASVVKSMLLSRLLNQRINNWRWALVWAAIPAGIVGWAATRFLPEWAELALGIPAILGLYCWVIWVKGFGHEDRVLFRKSAVA
jgi:O-antigen/teichoic acid export membrane protein